MLVEESLVLSLANLEDGWTPLVVHSLIVEKHILSLFFADTIWHLLNLLSINLILLYHFKFVHFARST